MDPLGALSSLGDATRRRIYDHVAAQTAPVSREEVAAGRGVGRTLAAYHLDRLAAEGLLDRHPRAPHRPQRPGRGTPGEALRPLGAEVAVSVPPRDYHLAARLLADAAAADTDGHDAPRARRRRGAARARARASTARRSEPLLRERGYEPYDDDGVVRLRNCPFHAVAQRHPGGRLRHEPRAARRAGRGAPGVDRHARARPRAGAASRSGRTRSRRGARPPSGSSARSSRSPCSGRSGRRSRPGSRRRSGPGCGPGARGRSASSRPCRTRTAGRASRGSPAGRGRGRRRARGPSTVVIS